MSQAARDLLESIPLNQTMGITFAEIGPGTCTAQLKSRSDLHNHIGTLHAAALFGLAEAASGAAVAAAFADKMGQVLPLAKEATIRYRKVAKGAVTAKAELLQKPDDLMAQLPAAEKGVEADVRVLLTDEHGTEATEVTVRWFLKKVG